MVWIIGEEQATLSSYDEACGTHNSADYNASHSTCKGKHFLCGDEASSCEAAVRTPEGALCTLKRRGLGNRCYGSLGKSRHRVVRCLHGVAERHV